MLNPAIYAGRLRPIVQQNWIYFAYAGFGSNAPGKRIDFYDSSLTPIETPSFVQPDIIDEGGGDFEVVGPTVCHFSPDGRYFAVVVNDYNGGTPRHLYIYSVKTLELVFNLQEDVASTASPSQCIAFSDNAEYLAVILSNDFVRIYNTNTWEYTSVPEVFSVRNVIFTKDSNYLILIKSSSPKFVFVDLFDFSQSTDKISSTSFNSSTIYRVALNNDGTRMFLLYSASNRMELYDTTSFPWTRITIPSSGSIIPSSSIFDVNVSPDGTKLAIASSNTPYITILNIVGDTFTKVPNPSPLPPGARVAARWSGDGRFLATAGVVTQSLHIYQADANFAYFTPPSIPSYSGRFCAFYPHNPVKIPGFKFRSTEGGISVSGGVGEDGVEFVQNPNGPDFGHQHAYDFEETSGTVANDSKGNIDGIYSPLDGYTAYGQPGAVGNTIETTKVTSEPATSGYDIFLRVPNSVWGTTQDVSLTGQAIEFFVKATFNTDNTNSAGFITNDALINGGNRQFFFNVLNASPNTFNDSDSGGFIAGCSGASQSSTEGQTSYVVNHSTLIVDGTWHHILMQVRPVGSDHVFEVYVDGVLASSSTLVLTLPWSGLVAGSSGYIWVRSAGNSLSYGTITMDELKIYNNKSFTPEQVTNIYNVRTS